MHKRRIASLVAAIALFAALSLAPAHTYPDPQMIYIPAGSFLMGNNYGEMHIYPDEDPQHLVYLSGYWIGRHEVTRGEFRQFIDAGGYSNPVFWSADGWSWRVSRNRTEPDYWNTQQDWGTGVFSQTEGHPVVGVTYYEAEAFCNWAGGHLPTEAQWEKAARGTCNTYPWGALWDAERCNNYDDSNPAGGGYAKYETATVGSYPLGESPYGCHDMSGNVSEWCMDWHLWDYYRQTPAGGWVDPQGPTYGNGRILRGGSWYWNGNIWYRPDDFCRCAYRGGDYQYSGWAGYAPDLSQNDVGFRLVREQSGPILSLTPNVVTTIGQTVSAVAFLPGAMSATLSVHGDATLPPLPMLPANGNNWTCAFPTCFLSSVRYPAVIVSATGGLPDGSNIVATSLLYVQTAPSEPGPPSPQLRLWSDDTQAHGLATSTFEILSTPGAIPLEAKLLMTQYLDLWFGIGTSYSGRAIDCPPDGWSLPEILGRLQVVDPCGTIAWKGSFYNPGDSITIELILDTPLAATANVAMILMSLIPGASSVAPGDLASALQDLRGIAAIGSAADAFSPTPKGIWGWSKACGKAAWSLRKLATDGQQRAALRSALSTVGLNVSDDALKNVFTAVSAYSLLKIISSEIVYMVQTGGDTLKSTFTAYGAVGGSGISSLSLDSALEPAIMPASVSTQSESGEVTVQASVVPTTTDWTVNYTIENPNASPLWSWTLYYDAQAGTPLEVQSPSGWNSVVGAENGTILWYTEGPGGWLSGDFGTSTIAPSGSLPGFSVRSTAPPGYSMAGGQDTSYSASFGETIAPCASTGIGNLKLRCDSLPKAASDKIVTAVLPDCYYISDPNRLCGIRVTGSLTPIVGDLVRLVGYTAEVDGEAVLQATSELVVSHSEAPRPLGMPNLRLGGGACGLQEAVTGGKGVSNIGLLIRTWGKVTGLEDVEPPALPTWFTIDDGSGVNLKCKLPEGMTAPDVNAFVQVTGISSCERVDGDLHRVLLVRKQSDVVTVREG